MSDNKLEAALYDPQPTPNPDRFQIQAKACVLESLKGLIGIPNTLSADDLYVVWFAKTLQNWKALVSTDAFASAYFEVTYDGNKEQAYVDMYAKHHNTVITDKQLTATDH